MKSHTQAMPGGAFYISAFPDFVSDLFVQQVTFIAT